MKHAWKIFAALAVCPVLLGASLAMAQSDDDDWPSDDEAPAVSTPAAPVAVAAPKSNVKKIALALPGPPRFAPITSQKIKAAEAKVRKYPTTKQWRDLSEMYLQIGRRDKAASALRSEAALHRRIGTTQAALIMEQRAAQYETDIRLFLDRAPTPTELKTLPIIAPAAPKELPILPPRAKFNPVEYAKEYYHAAKIERQRREEYARNSHGVLGPK